MNRRRPFMVVAGVAVAAAAAGAGVHLWRLTGEAGSAASLNALRLSDVAGQMQDMSQWRGKVLVVNFWATWCAPCREEIPILVRLQDKYRERGLQLVGVAIDQREKVEAFAREFKMNYVLLLGGLETIDVTRQIGNRVGALPFTVVIDRGGVIVNRELGKVKEAPLEQLIESLL